MELKRIGCKGLELIRLAQRKFLSGYCLSDSESWGVQNAEEFLEKINHSQFRKEGFY
jgi:hypothetical protein